MYGWNDPSITLSNSAMPTETTLPSETPIVEEDEDVSHYNVLKSPAIAGTTLAPEVTSEGRYGYLDIVYVNSHVTLDETINKYADDAHPVLRTLTSDIKNDAEFFNEFVLLIVPFAHTSTEKEIELAQIELGSNAQPTKLHFELYSPEFNDMDTLVTFHVLAIGNWASDFLSESTFKIIVHNTFDSSNKSVFYR